MKNINCLSGALMVIAIVIGVLLSLTTQWLLATNFTKTEFGLFSGVWALVQMLLQFCIFGTHHVLLNRASRNGYWRWLPHVAIISIINFTVIFLTGFSLFLLGIVDSQYGAISSQFIVWLIASIPVSIVYTLFQVRGSKVGVAWWPVLQLVLRLLGVVIIIMLGQSISSVALTYSLSAVFLAGVGLLVLNRAKQENVLVKQRASSRKFSKSKLLTTYRTSFPYFTFEFMEKVDLKLAVPLSLLLLGPELSAGITIAVGILLAALVVPQAMFQRYYLARMHSWSNNDQSRLTHFVLKAGVSLFILSGVIVVIIYPMLQAVVSFVFLGKYNEIVPLIEVMLLIIPFLLLTNILNNRFLSVRDIKLLRWFQLSSLLVLLALFYLFSLVWGGLGICYAILSYRIFYLLGLLVLKNFKSSDAHV